jgi:hypothetical protein
MRSSIGPWPRTPGGCDSIAPMVAGFWFLADAAEEGRNVVLSMLVVGLVFVGAVLLGDLTHYLAAKRRKAKLSRPL